MKKQKIQAIRLEALQAQRAHDEALFRAARTVVHYDKSGLSADQVNEQREAYGVNKVTRGRKKSIGKRLLESFINPFTVILLILALVSTFTDILIPLWEQEPENVHPMTVIIVLVMVAISGLLQFIQEGRSGAAADQLLDLISTTCTVRRAGRGTVEIPLDELVVGDVVLLSAGDMIPADLRIVEAKDCFVSQAALSGESEPVEKLSELPRPEATEEAGLTDLQTIALTGSDVVSGTAVGVVLAVGDQTHFASIARAVSREETQTSFSQGVSRVSWVLIRFMLVMVPIVFFINGFTKHDWTEAFIFAISIAVGLTPEMLPMIVTTALAKGAMAMAKKKTIVKNLNAIQNFGAMDVLCTDKTGTLTQNRVVLQYHLNINGEEDDRVLRHAYLNSYFQTGYKNLMDLAIINRTEEQEKQNPALVDLSEHYIKVDEVPFDFNRRRLSVVVEDGTGKRQMITKGAVEEMLEVCTYVESDGQVRPLDEEQKARVLADVLLYNEGGMRVLAVAQKTNPSPVGTFGIADEQDMVLIGYLAFLDPPKASTAAALQALTEHGVVTKILTGDNEKVARCVCKQVGLAADNLLLGTEIEHMSDDELAAAVEQTDLFAKLTPLQKERVVGALRKNGHVVGFLGDGINDAPAMKAADVAVSVDNAVDIAKESASIILLEKDLMVLEEGIVEGRKTYANMIKYIKMTASSNFGNVFSVLMASALLPFLPMKSIQLIMLNLVYDLSCTAIPWDNVDPEYLVTPRSWSASSVSAFMLRFGPVSSIFDWLTYALMYFVVCPAFVSDGRLFTNIAAGSVVGSGLLAGMDMQQAYIALFQTGWFVASMWTQSMVIHMIRTPKVPFLQSRASVQVTLATLLGAVALTLIPFTPLGALIGLVPLPGIYFVYLALILVGYMALTTLAKKAYIRRYGELL